jgi:hypothetical protein
VFLQPVVLTAREAYPTAVLSEAVVLHLKVPLPIAVLLDPVELQQREAQPNAEFETPVVFAINVVLPTAVFFRTSIISRK